MKFGKQLALGTYPPWRDHYISYNRLKRIINRRRFIADQEKGHEKRSSSAGTIQLTVLSRSSSPLSQQQQQQQSDEHSPLAAGGSTTPERKYASTSITPGGTLVIKGDEGTATDFFPVILSELNKINKFFLGKLASLRLSLEEITERRRDAYHAHHTGGGDQNYLLALRDIYVELAALRSFCDLNRTGFYKILKKYDKVMQEESSAVWMPLVDRQAFAGASEPAQLMDIVGTLVSRDKLLEWERFATEQGGFPGRDDTFPSVRPSGLVFSIIIFAASLVVPMVTPGDPFASRCMSLLLLVVSLWITEALPYFATALLIPPLVVFLRVLKDSQDPTQPMATEAAAQFVLNHIFNHTTMLLLGGYAISGAFSSCRLELRAASFLQQHLGESPQLFILAIMFLGLFLSMWISNHTAPILLTTIVLPVVRDLPSDSRFSKALLVALAFGCNFGGMMTPISSLQNVLAVSYLEQSGIDVGFGRWVMAAVPFCVLCVLVAWVSILAIMTPNDVTSIPVIVHEKEALTRKNVAVITLSLLTIVMFATQQLTKGIFGDIGIISLCYLAIMFGSGMLSEVDFNSLNWHTLFLVGGGNVLGKAVQVSGLLEYLADGIVDTLPLNSPWLALVFILFFVMTISVFVSHTVSAIILMPIITRIGVSLQIPEVVVIGSAWACSCAMALPFSSFPNVNSLHILDDFHRPYLGVHDFIRAGLPMSVISVLLIGTVGFGMINLVFG